MDKDTLLIKINELDAILKKIDKKKKEIEKELSSLRYKFYAILEEEELKKKEEESNRPPPDTSFLDNEDWSGFS
jgi:hypothetical protein